MDEVAQLELHPPTVDTKATGGSNSAAPSDGKSQTAATKPVRTGPIPMSMPSILRNPGSSQSNHLSYLLDRRSGSSSYPPSSSRTKPRSGAKEQLGRRKQRRSENARLLSNPHAVRPTIKDYRLHSNEIRSTFHGTPGASKGSVPVPANSGVGYSEPVHDAASAMQGHFGKSLRDAQRVLKRLEIGNISDEMIRTQRAGELERFIWLVDREIRMWAQEEIHIYTPTDRKQGRILLDAEFNFTTPMGGKEEAPTVALDEVQRQGQLVEFQRTPNALVWLVHDPFLRLVVHCLARVSRCPSFSKDDPSRPGLRFTWILNSNPHARRPRRGRRVSVSSSAVSAEVRPAVGAIGMDTPPTTDFDSQTETESELDASDIDSLAESVQLVALEGEGEPVDTDEDEAEILRRVHRWAIDSHRQRHADSQDAATKRTKRTTRIDQDPDQTLTTAIAEDDEEDHVDEDEDSDAHSA